MGRCLLAIFVLVCHQNVNGATEDEAVQKPTVLNDVQKHPKLTKLQHFETIEAQLGKLRHSDDILTNEIRRTRELLEETAKGATLAKVIKNSKMVEAIKKAGSRSGSAETGVDANIDVETSAKKNAEYSESDVETIAVNAKKDVERSDPNPKRVHGRRAHRLLKVVKNAEEERKDAEKNALEQTAIAISDYSKLPPLQLVKEGKQVIESLVRDKADSTMWFGKLAEAAKNIDAKLNQKADPDTAQKRKAYPEFGKFMTDEQKLKRQAKTKSTLGELVADMSPVKLYQDIARQNKEFNKWDPEAEPEPTLGENIGNLVAKIPPVKLYQDLARQNKEFNKWDPEAEPEPTLGETLGNLVAKIPPVKLYQDLARQTQEINANQARMEEQDKEEAEQDALHSSDDGGEPKKKRRHGR